ncbi:MAG: BCCT family transporter, partial [Puniceicoccales bacterium]
MAVTCVVAPEWSQSALNSVKALIFKYLSWFYLLVVSIFLGFLLLLAMSSLGNIRLGRSEEDPEFPFLSWLAMLFAAGMGVGLMFFGVAEPLTHAIAPIEPGDASEHAEDALLYTAFHWGVHAWTIYGLIA